MTCIPSRIAIAAILATMHKKPGKNQKAETIPKASRILATKNGQTLDNFPFITRYHETDCSNSRVE